MKASLVLLIAFSVTTAGASAQERARARDLGIPLDGTPGPLNAITDVRGVEVGHSTLISGDGALQVGRGPVRTGVTAVHPRGRGGTQPVFGGWFTLNAAGEMTGTTWLEERGLLEGPILITNTHSVGVVRDAAIAWMLEHGWAFDWTVPVVAETYDGTLSDINGFHVRKEHAFAALNDARGGPVREGAVGGGTGMICHGFKGGIGTASRRLSSGRHTVGVLVQCNYGSRAQLRVAGIPVGREIRDAAPCYVGEPPAGSRTQRCGAGSNGEEPQTEGSIIVVIATDAPLLPHQLTRVAKRASLGIARMGGIGGNGSGDIFVAFSTANPGVTDEAVPPLSMLPNEQLTPLFEATTEATEEAILNAMLAATTTTGVNGLRFWALPHDQVQSILRKHNRLAEPARPDKREE